jgi:hypothetical protein
VAIPGPRLALDRAWVLFLQDITVFYGVGMSIGSVPPNPRVSATQREVRGQSLSTVSFSLPIAGFPISASTTASGT